eukprot:gb/GFBE01003914.1/.p1 GENE.gb/GFBE01003914.1/~~gb/GFBE01003914.1/.p1  ORF type:complete len:339 (+),score=52.22 gb/GFBE01003914.1/:1-1017(+)
MAAEDEADAIRELPPALTGRDVTHFLEAYGYFAHTPLDWRPTAAAPELKIRVTGHITSGKHTLYTLECSLRRPGHRRRPQPVGTLGTAGLKETLDTESSSSLSTAATTATGSSDETAEADEPAWLAWRASRRLAHLRAGLHDLVKHRLGSSYQTYFCKVPFAQRLRPAGTTARLDAWCSRLAYCISAKLVPPTVAAETLRLLGAPALSEGTRDAERPQSQDSPVAPVRPAIQENESFAGFWRAEWQQAELVPDGSGERPGPYPAGQCEQPPIPVRKHPVDILLPGLEFESDGEENASSAGSSPSRQAPTMASSNLDEEEDDRFLHRMKSKSPPADPEL